MKGEGKRREEDKGGERKVKGTERRGGGEGDLAHPNILEWRSLCSDVS